MYCQLISVKGVLQVAWHENKDEGKAVDDDMEEEIDVFDLEVGKPISPYDVARWVPH